MERQKACTDKNIFVQTSSGLRVCALIVSLLLAIHGVAQAVDPEVEAACVNRYKNFQDDNAECSYLWHNDLLKANSLKTNSSPSLSFLCKERKIGARGVYRDDDSSKDDFETISIPYFPNARRFENGNPPRAALVGEWMHVRYIIILLYHCEIFDFEHKFHVHSDFWWIVICIECGSKGICMSEKIYGSVLLWLRSILGLKYSKMYYKWYIPFVCERFEKFLIFNIHFTFICNSSSVHMGHWVSGRDMHRWKSSVSFWS